MKHALCWLVIASFLATPAIATAAQNALERARILFDAGVQAYTAGRYQEAVESFKEAYVLSDKAQALFSLAQAERRLYVVSQNPQFLRDSIAHFRKYLDVVPEGGRRGDAAESLEQLDVLAARETMPVEATTVGVEGALGKLLVSSTTPGATIRIDGSKAADSPALEVVKPGKHLVRVSAPGYITEEREIVAVEKALVPIEISLREEPAFLSVTTRAGATIVIDGQLYGDAPLDKRIEMRSGAHTVRVSLAGHHARQTSIQLIAGKSSSVHLPLSVTRQRVVSYVLFGAAGAGFIGAGVQGVLALREQSAGQTILEASKTGNISQAQLDQLNASVNTRDVLRNTSLLTVITAGVFGLAGAITYVYDTQRTSDSGTTTRTTVGFSMTLTPSIAGINMTGRF